ncbi:MAG: anti-sigma factor family protein [Planctomycetota bacterium]|jgi:predicted anti-sigma-YlaC factor YlaD
MKYHLTEQELIEYQFKLASDARIEEIAAHLEGCVQCRENLERLEQKFVALDLLREEVKVSEELISQVVEQAGQPVRTRFISIRKPAWIGSAAAVLLVGLLLVAAHLGGNDTKRHEVVKGPSKQATDEMKIVEKKLGVSRVRQDFAAVATSEIAEAAMPEQPPFAPASAIELVTLPRRDKVQLTIYNSADLTLVRERRNLTMKKGWNWLQFMWANTLIDPTSLNLEPLEQGDKWCFQRGCGSLAAGSFVPRSAARYRSR